MAGLSRIRAPRASLGRDESRSSRKHASQAKQRPLLIERDHLRRDLAQIAMGILPEIGATEIELIQARLEELNTLIGDRASPDATNDAVG